jgi:hypothetical protein
MPKSAKYSFSFRPPHQYLVCISLIPNMCHHLRPSPGSNHHPDNIRRRVLVMKLFFMQFSPVSCFFFPFRKKYLSSPYSRTSSDCKTSLNDRNQVSHPYKTTAKIMFLCILIFISVDSKWEQKRFWVDW